MANYKSFCWSMGSTSFRTSDFNVKIERQLSLIRDFWASEGNKERKWDEATQTDYYDFLYASGFVTQIANNKAKDARQKTSGLADLGLLNKNHRLTAAADRLLEITSGEISADNQLKIDNDSMLYLCQLLKMTKEVDNDICRPFVVTALLLNRFGKLTWEQFTYVLPLVVNQATLANADDFIRRGNGDINGFILGVLMSMNNYKEGLKELLDAPDVDEALIMSVGMNRKSPSYDKPYLPLCQALHRVYCLGDNNALPDLVKAVSGVKQRRLWNDFLIKSKKTKDIRSLDRGKILNPSAFDATAGNEKEFRRVFFETMHLLKAKSTLRDYADQNRRYMQLSDCLLFSDSEVCFDDLPRAYFSSVNPALEKIAFIQATNREKVTALSEIEPALAFEKQAVINEFNRINKEAVKSIDEIGGYVDRQRHIRFNQLIDTRFTDEVLIELLGYFEAYGAPEDTAYKKIRETVTDNADVPAIFEYIIAVIWYKVSGRSVNPLEAIQLSLDSNLLPKSHAKGGEADIVYAYRAEKELYPAHKLLIEATLSSRTNQRKMEMEPVSRHIGRHILSTGNLNSYALFVAPYLDNNVIIDFHSRRMIPFEDPVDENKFVDGTKIIPLSTGDLKRIMEHGVTYKRLYDIFERAYRAEERRSKWYRIYISEKI